MSAQVVSFLRRSAAPRDWSAQELAEFYRVESALIQAGLRVVSARGLSDEGEPWFVFCREEDDEVIVHFARIDGRYLISAPAYCGTVRGHDFRALVRSTIERHPLLQPRPRGDNLFLHPAALLVALVASAFLRSGHAAEAAPARPAAAHAIDGKHFDVASIVAPAPAAAGKWEARNETLILAAIIAATTAPAQVQAAPGSSVMTASAHLTEPINHLPEQPLQHALPDSSADAAAHGSSSVGQTVEALERFAAVHTEVPPLEFAHVVSPSDAASGLPISSAVGPATHPALPLSMAQPLMPAETPIFSTAPAPALGAQHLPLTTLSSIPQADLGLLHTLGVPDEVLYTATLPTDFAQVLQSGVHTSVSQLAVAHAPSNGVATPPAAAEPGATQGLEHSAPTAEATASPPGPTAPTADATPPTAGTTAPTGGTVTPTVGITTAQAPVAPMVPDFHAVLAAVEQFQAVEMQPAVVLTAHAAIFYDAAAVDGYFGVVKSVTYDFGDGFSVSLVGLPGELAHAGLHV